MTYLQLRRCMSRRTRWLRLLLLLGVFALALAYTYFGMIKNYMTFDATHEIYTDSDHNFMHRHLLSNDTEDSGMYPPSVFTMYQKRHGAIFLHVFGMIYMFVALAIICDEFFVPALGVITEKLQISEDVAGATFMAAGGSAPELFTSLIGVFLAKSNVGIGTIVGSAVFNILFVIGMCAMFSKGVLTLTWWPLFRDVSFYSIALILLIVSFLDNVIEWYEALILFLFYICYVTFMKFNAKIESAVKGCIKRVNMNKVASTDALLRHKHHGHIGVFPRRWSLPMVQGGGNRFRHGMLQLMIHSIDPASFERSHDSPHDSPPHKWGAGLDSDNNVRVTAISNGKISPFQISNGKMSPKTTTSPLPPSPSGSKNSPARTSPTLIKDTSVTIEAGHGAKNLKASETPEANPQKEVDAKSECSSLEEDDEPLDISWPDTARKRLIYLLIAPLVFPLWITLPDVRRVEKRKWFPCTFIGSILWIGAFSFLMVWWAHETGTTIGIPPEVMGLTILAAGTSVPDLITSVIVAKKGYGDMAVSSSVGSNIFDITVGLPFPWMLYSAFNGGASKDVSSSGLLCSIVLLFIMLLTVIISIAVNKWRMSRILGISMFMLYVVFLTLSVLLEFKVILCPKVF